MSQENVELMRSFVEDFLAGSSGPDREAMLTRLARLWDPEIEWDVSLLQLPDLPPTGRGRDAMRRSWAEFLEAWETARFEYELVDAGDHVILLLDQLMRGRATGIELSMGIAAYVATFRDGLIVSWNVYASKPEALKAVRLEE